MYSTMNEFKAISRNPTGRPIWPSVIEKIDHQSLSESNEHLSEALNLLAIDLVERDQHDIDTIGRRLYTSDQLEPLSDSYFNLIEAIGNLEAEFDTDNYYDQVLLNSAIVLAASIRERINAKKS